MKKVKKATFKKNSLFRRAAVEAQTFVEYSLLIGIVVAILLAMAPLLRRGTQGLVRTVADQIGNQQAADQDAGTGHIEGLHTKSLTLQTKTRKEYLGTITSDVYETVGSATNEVSNLGFTED